MMAPEQLKPEPEKLHKLCDWASRDFCKIDITMFSPVPGADAHVAVREYQRVGVPRVVLFPPTCATERYERELEELAGTRM